MRFQEIQRMAKGMGINPYRMKKTNIIQSIQRKENNIDCYDTDRVDHCNETGCLWRSDCLSLNGNAKAN
ncbi:MAG: SAP domain-containing protein [Desulfobacterales bacterium]|nr:SAP domain-containing protein [Desulfobacterales bacterium]